MNVREIIARFLQAEATSESLRRQQMFRDVAEGLRLRHADAIKMVRGLRKYSERPVYAREFLDDHGDPFMRLYLEDETILDFFYDTSKLLVVERPDFYAS